MGKRISLVIPAWNEEAYLPRLLESVAVATRAFPGGSDAIETIVADNMSTDRTAEIAREFGCRVARVEKRCIAAARNGGAAIATGEIVAFCDADFRIAANTFTVIDAIMSRSEYVGGGTGITMERWSLGIRATWWLILRPLMALGFDGGVWFCRREDFQTLGGYNETVRAGEDVRFLRSLQLLGKSRNPRQTTATRHTARKLGLEPALVINSSRKFDRHGDWHMFRDFAWLLFCLAFSPRRFDDHVDRYWYRGRG